jgi:HupE/UreJ protein
VHGFGFASVLAELDLPARNLAGALLGFNLGVEAGQTVVIALTLPALMWVRGRAWEPRFVRVLSGGLAVVGGAWCLERLLVR